MEPQYYHVKRYDSPEANGIVVRLSEGLLETFAGESPPAKLGFSVDSQGKLFVGPGYFYSLIGEKTALKLREDYLSWKTLQGYVATDTHPINVFFSTSGLTRH